MIGGRAHLGRAERVAVWCVLLLGCALAAVSVVVTVRFSSDHPVEKTAGVVAGVASVLFPAVGAVIVLRGGERRVGWTLLVIGVCLTFDAVASGWATAYTTGRIEAWGRWAAWTDEWVWTFLLLGVWWLLGVFPDGRPFGRTGRLYLALAALVGVLLLSTRPFHGGRLSDYPSVDTPLPRVAGLREWGDLVTWEVSGPLLTAVFVLAFATLGYRYVRSDALRRTQLRWLAWQFGLTVAVLLLQRVPILTEPMQVVSLVGIPLLPVAIGLAMFRERLYDIDRVISRTLSYALLTGALAALYAGIVTLASTFVPARFGSVGVAAATLAVAALFVPARRVLQSTVDRRFDRARVSHRRTVATFAHLTRQDVDPHRVTSGLLAAVDRTVAPTHVSVWLDPRR